MYAKKLTKEDLMKYGVTKVTEDGHVYAGDVELVFTPNKAGYLMHNFDELDENDNKIKILKKGATKPYQYTYKKVSIGLHRVMYAWFYGVPENMVVDHISNSHHRLEDYHLSNLQLLTPGENIAKDRDNWHTNELKCDITLPRSHYEQLLEGYTMAYEQAKLDKDDVAAHRLRTRRAQTMSKLRYYDKHIKNEELVEELTNRAKERHERAAKRKELQANIDSARKYYKEVLEVYGKDDPYVKQLWGEWKLAIAMLHGFKEECKKKIS